MKEHLVRVRRADSDERRARVLAVLDETPHDEFLTISEVARRAGVHRSFIHRHGDLRNKVAGRFSYETLLNGYWWMAQERDELRVVVDVALAERDAWEAFPPGSAGELHEAWVAAHRALHVALDVKGGDR